MAYGLGYPLYINGREVTHPTAILHLPPGCMEPTSGLGKINLGFKVKFNPLPISFRKEDGKLKVGFKPLPISIQKKPATVPKPPSGPVPTASGSGKGPFGQMLARLRQQAAAVMASKAGSGAQIVQGPFDKGVPAAYVAAATCLNPPCPPPGMGPSVSQDAASQASAQVDSAINWTYLGLGVLGVAALGGIAYLALRKRGPQPNRRRRRPQRRRTRRTRTYRTRRNGTKWDSIRVGSKVKFRHRQSGAILTGTAQNTGWYGEVWDVRVPRTQYDPSRIFTLREDDEDLIVSVT